MRSLATTKPGALARIDPTNLTMEVTTTPTNGNNSVLQVGFGQQGGYVTSRDHNPVTGARQYGLFQFCWTPYCGNYQEGDGFEPFAVTDSFLTVEGAYPGIFTFAPVTSGGADVVYAHGTVVTGTRDHPIFINKIYSSTYVSNLGFGTPSATYDCPECDSIFGKFGGAGGLAVSPDGRFLYASPNPYISNLRVWDTSGALPSKLVNLPLVPGALLVASDGTIYSVTPDTAQVDIYWPAAFASGELSAAMPGIAYSDRVRATGNPWPVFTLTAGSLPAGLTMQSDGTITGTPTAGATSATFTVKMTNDLAAPVSKQVTIQIQ